MNHRFEQEENDIIWRIVVNTPFVLKSLDFIGGLGWKYRIYTFGGSVNMMYGMARDMKSVFLDSILVKRYHQSWIIGGVCYVKRKRKRKV